MLAFRPPGAGRSAADLRSPKPGAGGAWLRVAALGLVRGAALGLLLAASTPGAWDQPQVQAAAERRGPRTAEAARALLLMVAQAGRLDEVGRVNAVNDFYNRRVAFRDDASVWGQNDYWASPLEMLEKGQGDCEDYAIAKYFTLVAMGVPGARLRLVYVRAQLGGPSGPVQAHMVLAYYPSPSAEPLILDNLIGEVRPAGQRPDLAPVFSFNAEGLWQGVGSTTAGDPVARLSRWRDVLAKVRQEGLW